MNKVVFYGGSKYVLPILQVLKPVLVVTTEKYSTDPVIKFCLETNTPYLSVKTVNDPETHKKLAENVTEVAILADFGLIISKDLLNLYPKGIVNVHPSLLPKYRGPTPGPSTILNNEKETGVTLIKLDWEVDHGPIIAQSKTNLLASYTSEDLYLDLFEKGAKLITENLDKYISGEIQPSEQNHTNATYTQKITRESGYIDINNPPEPVLLDRMIRAYYPWPGVWSKVQMADGRWQIVKLLPYRKIQMEGKKPTSLKDFYNGYPELKKILQRLFSNSTEV